MKAALDRMKRRVRKLNGNLEETRQSVWTVQGNDMALFHWYSAWDISCGLLTRGDAKISNEALCNFALQLYVCQVPPK